MENRFVRVDDELAKAVNALQVLTVEEAILHAKMSRLPSFEHIKNAVPKKA